MATDPVPTERVVVHHPRLKEVGGVLDGFPISGLLIEKRGNWWKIHVESHGRPAGSLVVPAADGASFVSRLHPAEAAVPATDATVMEQQLSFIANHHEANCECGGKKELFLAALASLTQLIHNLPRKP